jgi:hypothetical protein
MHRSNEVMNSISNFQKIGYFGSFHSKAEKHYHLCLYICVLPCFMAISAWIYIVLTGMKQCNEAMKR